MIRWSMTGSSHLTEVIGFRRVADRSDVQNCPVVFVGTRSARIPNTAARGEVIGYSYFDFGLTNIGINNRTTAYLTLWD